MGLTQSPTTPRILGGSLESTGIGTQAAHTSPTRHTAGTSAPGGTSRWRGNPMAAEGEEEETYGNSHRWKNNGNKTYAGMKDWAFINEALGSEGPHTLCISGTPCGSGGYLFPSKNLLDTLSYQPPPLPF